ncbi:MAG: RNA polymerase sigma factor [Draconibacterium sp.]
MTDKINLDKIISELAKDNEAPLEDLFNHYYPRLYNFSRSFLKIEEDIDDILQEVFVKIWLNRKKINSAATFNSFIFTITRNLLLNALRSRLNNENIKGEILKLSLAEEYSQMEQVEYLELKEKVNILVNELPERQKEIFILSREEGLSHKEIAEKLGISTKTVEYHINQSIKHLKKYLKEMGLMSVLFFYLFF